MNGLQRTTFITKAFSRNTPYWKKMKETILFIRKKYPKITDIDEIEELEISSISETNKYYKQLEQAHKKSIKVNSAELQEIYGVSEEDANKAQIKNLKNKLKEKDEQICYSLELFYKHQKNPKTPLWFLEIEKEDIEKLKTEYYKLQKQIHWLKSSPSRRQEDDQSFDIERIKSVEIKQVLENYNIEIINNKILCPIHEEATPSCVIYENTNTFHCFGCGAGKSVIDLLMAIEKIDFVSACKILDKM